MKHVVLNLLNALLMSYMQGKFCSNLEDYCANVLSCQEAEFLWIGGN